MNHISLQSIILSTHKVKDKTIDKKIEYNEYKEYNGWKFWYDCSSFFN